MFDKTRQLWNPLKITVAPLLHQLLHNCPCGFTALLSTAESSKLSLLARQLDLTAISVAGLFALTASTSLHKVV